ncbi:hypothetical protein CPC08DRAFT_727540 [Agrocybe pediades]|nr:hypothetical protein CPC08DRAFT_727540 [Agrocybe pediades]
MPSISNTFRTFGRDKSPPIGRHTSSVDVTVRQWSLAKGRQSDDSSKTLVESIYSPPMGEADARQNNKFGSSNSQPATASAQKELAASTGKSNGSQSVYRLKYISRSLQSTTCLTHLALSGSVFVRLDGDPAACLSFTYWHLHILDLVGY